MMILLVMVHVVVSLVLIAVILLQAGKGGGLSESFGGASQQLFGTKSSAFLNRATSVCAVLFLMTCLSLGILSGHGRKSLLEQVKPEASKKSTIQTQEVPVEGNKPLPLDEKKTEKPPSAP